MANKKKSLVKHYVKVDTTVAQAVPKVTVQQKSNTLAAKFDFPICEMASNLNLDAKINFAQIITAELNEKF